MTTPILRFVVFAASPFSQPLIAYLQEHRLLAGVVMPDPQQAFEYSREIHMLAGQLQQAKIPYLWCAKEKLSEVPEYIQQWNPNVGLIAAYPNLLPQALLDYFNCGEMLGVYNIHAGDLPHYRGPQPLYWQIRQQVDKTSICIHHAEVSADSGAVVCRHSMAIDPLDTLSSLTNRVAFELISPVKEMISNLHKTACKLAGDEQHFRKDEHATAPRPGSEDLLINFSQHCASEISAMSRAGNHGIYAPVLEINRVPHNILQATAVDFPTYGTQPGTVIFIGEPEGLIVSALESAVRLDILASAQGVFTGLAYAERFKLEAGMRLQSVSSPQSIRA